MAAPDCIRDRFPRLGSHLPRVHLAELPTPVRQFTVNLASNEHPIAIKYDNLTGSRYGGNKVRKLEYLIAAAREKHHERVATFGAAGSNHALATALYAKARGLDCTCFLSHQSPLPSVAATLNKHIECGTTVVHYGGSREERAETVRQQLAKHPAYLIPPGGSSWLGNMGFVAAALELSDQADRGEFELPDRLYVASGTMGTAVGLAIGLAIAGLDVEVHAVRVSDVSIMNRDKLALLLRETAKKMRRLDDSVPDDLPDRANVRVRDEFFGPGYAEGTDRTFEAIALAEDKFDLVLEPTYTGKAMAALLQDWREDPGFSALYWHTCNSTVLNVPVDAPLEPAALPGEFLRYFRAS